MRSRTLLTQVLAVNAVLVAVTAFVAAVLVRERFSEGTSGRALLLLGLAVLAVILLNSILLRRRLESIERLVRTMDDVELATPGTRATVPRHAAKEVAKLTQRFNDMLDRIEEERRAAGGAVLRAQEQERQRIAQDLHDEVNQALTAIKLRLSATMQSVPSGVRGELEETASLVDSAMDELLHLARQLRPTALDDHGLIPALRSQVQDFADRTGIHVSFSRHGNMPPISDDQQLVIYRVTQESLSNVAQHARARKVDVEISFTGRTVLRIRDDGRGFPGNNGRPRGRAGGLGLTGMRERALLVGGNLSIYTAAGEGTTVELTMGAK